MVLLKSLLRTPCRNLFFRASLLKASGCIGKNTTRKMSVHLFNEADHAELYQKYRPTYGPELAEKIVTFVRDKVKTTPLDQAVDIGCGSGQSTVILAPHFQWVMGIDVSESQVAIAAAQNKLGNVQYRVGGAEHIPLPDSSVDLVTCGTSAHWFDFPKFHKELDRVLRPLGCLAIYCYSINYLSYKDVTQELNRIFDEFYFGPIHDYWHEKRWHVDDKYQRIPMPYKGYVRDDSMTIEMDYTLPGYIGYLSTWSSYREYCKRYPEDNGAILQNLQQRLYEATKATKPPEEVIIHVSYPVVLLMARKPHEEQTSL
ncbi:putative methyltransferase DDB_G0268948 isoform X1 [Branchiostoma floridae x Branchiostoma japonicum]